MKVADIGDSGSSDVGKRSRATGFFLPALRADNFRSLALTAASIAVAFLSWQAMSTFIFNPFLIPPPLEVIRTAVPMVLSGEIVADVSISMVRVLVGFTTGSLAAIVLGVLLGRLRLLHDLLDPIIELLRYLSPTAMIPIAVIWFGIGEMSKYFLIFWGTFFIVLINTIAGVWRAPIVRQRAAECLGGALAHDRRPPDPGDGIDEHDEERAPEDQEILRHLADAEPDDRDRDHRGRGKIAQQLDDRIEQIVQEAQATEQHAEHDGGERPGREAHQHAHHADRDVGDDLAAEHHGNGGPDHFERRRNQEGIEYECRHRLPGQECDGDRSRRQGERAK